MRLSSRLPLVVVAAALLFIACGDPERPCADTCGGCCDERGACIDAPDALACGAAGSACQACASGETCSAGACMPEGVATGGGGGGESGEGGGASGGGDGAGGGQTQQVTLRGHVTYDFVPAVYSFATDSGTLDFANSTQRPVRGGEVRALAGTRVLATTSTDEDGAWSLSFEPDFTGALTVQAVARTATPSMRVQDNTSRNAVWAIATEAPADGGVVDLHATHGWSGSAYVAAQRTAAPFAILDSLYGAARAVLTARPALALPPLAVNWSPANSTDYDGTLEDGALGTSFFDADSSEIYVLGKEGDDTDEYDDHVIVHEWGHYLEAAISRSDGLGGDHGTGDVLDPRDAFTEGWGDAASSLFTGDTLYVDSYFTGSGLDTWGFDLETDSTPTDDPNPGVFSESSVMRLIHDIADADNEAFDTMALGVGPLLDALAGSHRTTDAFATVASFITALKATPGLAAAPLDALAAHYGIGAITSDFGDGDAELRAMYIDVTSLPLTQTVSLNGRVDFNFKEQNRYWVLTGTGRAVTVTATSAKDVGVGAYRRGVELGFADDEYGNATETLTFDTVANDVYLINLIGFSGRNAYDVTVSISSP